MLPSGMAQDYTPRPTELAGGVLAVRHLGAAIERDRLVFPRVGGVERPDPTLVRGLLRNVGDAERHEDQHRHDQEQEIDRHDPRGCTSRAAAAHPMAAASNASTPPA